MSNWVMVPVPEDAVPEILEEVLQRVRQPRPTEVEARPPEDAYYGGWTEDELRNVLENPTRAMGIVLRSLATHPGEWLEINILAEEVYGEGASGNQLGGALGSFTRRVKGRYGKDKWPFEARYDEDEHQWKYRMDDRTAEVIRRILGL
jgi:hypothetical protein